MYNFIFIDILKTSQTLTFWLFIQPFQIKKHELKLNKLNCNKNKNVRSRKIKSVKRWANTRGLFFGGISQIFFKRKR